MLPPLSIGWYFVSKQNAESVENEFFFSEYLNLCFHFKFVFSLA